MNVQYVEQLKYLYWVVTIEYISTYSIYTFDLALIFFGLAIAQSGHWYNLVPFRS